MNKDNSLTFSLVLHDNNCIWIVANDSGKTLSSDTIMLKLGYHPVPIIKPYATVSAETVVLHASTISNPWKKIQYHWTDDARNPHAITIEHADDSVTSIIIPAITGVYYFNLAVTSGKDTAMFQTYVTRTSEKTTAFVIDSAHAAWIDSAILYEITPYAFVKNAMYDDITAKLPEIKSLGVTAIWLQPVLKVMMGRAMK